MTFDELIQRKAEILAAVAELTEAEKEINKKLDKAKQSKAFKIWENIQKELDELYELGYTFMACIDNPTTHRDEWYTYHVSITDLNLCDRDDKPIK